MGKFALDHGHPVGEVVHGTTDLVQKIKEVGESDGLVGAGSAQDVGAFALAGDHQALGDELPDGVACGHDGDVVSGGEVGQGGELVAGLVGAGGDGVAEVVSHALVGRSGISGVYLHNRTVPRQLAKP